MRATIYVMAVGRMDETLQSFDMYADEGRMAGLQQVRIHPFHDVRLASGQRWPARLTSRRRSSSLSRQASPRCAYDYRVHRDLR